MVNNSRGFFSGTYVKACQVQDPASLFLKEGGRGVFVIDKKDYSNIVAYLQLDDSKTTSEKRKEAVEFLDSLKAEAEEHGSLAWRGGEIKKRQGLAAYKYRITIVVLGIISTLSAVGAGLTGNLLFYNGFTSSRYLAESVFSWRVSKKVPLILIGGLIINMLAVVLNMHQLAFMSSAAFALNSIVISWKVLGDKVSK